MSVTVTEVYEAFRKAGVDEALARSAAEAVMGTARGDILVTKADLLVTTAELKQQMAELKTELIKWNVGALAVLTGIFAAIVRLT